MRKSLIGLGFAFFCAVGAVSLRAADTPSRPGSGPVWETAPQSGLWRSGATSSPSAVLPSSRAGAGPTWETVPRSSYYVPPRPSLGGDRFPTYSPPPLPPQFVPAPAPAMPVRAANAYWPGDSGASDDETDATLASFQPAAPPVQPVQPIQPPTTQPPLPPPTTETGATAGGLGFGGLGALLATGTGAGGMGQSTTLQETQTSGSTGLADALRASSTVQNVEVQRRSPASIDPHIRGYKTGQIYTQADVAYWTPARQDLDTMLNKIDPGTVREVTVLPGPYGLRYGPGFAFIDVEREWTPRYECGFETHLDSSFSVIGNGGQIYGRETVSAGNENWGARATYGHRKGSDYYAGNGLLIPSSYETRDLNFEIGYSLSAKQRVEIGFQRFEQSDTEIPVQFFDIDSLNTYNFQARYIDEDPGMPWTKFTLGGWYNRTGYNGDTNRKYSDYAYSRYPVIQRVNYALNNDSQDPLFFGNQNYLSGRTYGAVDSGGMRTAMTFGEKDEPRLTVGGDYRYLTQTIREDFSIFTYPNTSSFERLMPPFAGPPTAIDETDFSTGLPHSYLRDGGLFAEWAEPVLEGWTVSLGARLDVVQTSARGGEVVSMPTGSERTDTLYAFYLMNDWKFDDHWTLRGGVGHGQRPPTLIERYSGAMFLSVLQTGFTRVVGDPRLKYERDWQCDLGLTMDYGTVRGRANVFQAYVLDYITLSGVGVIFPDFPDARLVRFVNTEYATLTGCDAAGEYDLGTQFTVFGALSYVQGYDHGIHAPLPAMPPLDSTVGLRFHDANGGRHWGMEAGPRMVATQDMTGAILVAGTPTRVEERTGGFTVWNIRGYYNPTKDLRFHAGINNLLNRTYQEHLDLRVFGPTGFPAGPTRVLAPGFTPYAGFEWVF